MSAQMLDVKLQPDLSAPERARRSLDEMLGTLGEELLDDIRLLVNELVTNSVKFAAGSGAIELKMKASEDAVRVEVVDEGPGFSPYFVEPTLEDTSGRGLFLVESLADRWGVRMNGKTCVWFEMEAPEEAKKDPDDPPVDGPSSGSAGEAEEGTGDSSYDKPGGDQGSDGKQRD